MSHELHTVSEDDLTDEEKDLIAIFDAKYGPDSDGPPIELTKESTQLARIAIANRRLHTALAELDQAVADAKDSVTWQQIGDELGISRQAARRRFLFTCTRRRPRNEPISA